MHRGDTPWRKWFRAPCPPIFKERKKKHLKSSLGSETQHVLAALSAAARTQPWLRRSLVRPVRQTTLAQNRAAYRAHPSAGAAQARGDRPKKSAKKMLNTSSQRGDLVLPAVSVSCVPTSSMPQIREPQKISWRLPVHLQQPPWPILNFRLGQQLITHSPRTPILNVDFTT